MKQCLFNCGQKGNIFLYIYQITFVRCIHGFEEDSSYSLYLFLRKTFTPVIFNVLGEIIIKWKALNNF